MSYKIAVASSDGVSVDVSFGGAAFFDIYEASGKEYHLLEKRSLPKQEELPGKCEQNNGCGESDSSCGGSGCGGGVSIMPKVERIADCRSVICKKIGFQAAKQLEKKAISGFDVEISVEEALTKIVNYFDKIDSHQSLRRLKD